MSSLPSSTTKRAKLDVDELTSLNTYLNRKSRSDLWPQRLEQASEDSSNMNSLLSTILNSLLSSLAKTTAKDSFISPFLPTEAEGFVEGFNLNERQEWEDGIRTCMERGDWSDLISYLRLQPKDTVTTGDTARTYIRPREGQESATERLEDLSGDAYTRRPGKRVRLQEPPTPPRTQLPPSQTKSSPGRLPRERFMPEMVSALEPFIEYINKLANGQLDTYLESIQTEGVTGLGVDLPNGPMLLLHSLGDYPDDMRLPKLFRSDTVHLFAVSGSGKTRLSLEGLCHEWGLYISCAGGAMGRPTGSGDFKAATLMMEEMSNWDGKTDNVDVAHRAFAMLICARVFVLKSLLEKLPSGTDAETARRRWVLAQVLPPFHRSRDIFAIVLSSLRAAYKADLIGFTSAMVDSLINRFGSTFFPGRLFAVVDEAQVAAEYLNESFRSITSGSEKRPVLHPLYNFLWSTGFFKGVVLAGTGLSMKMLHTAVDSQYAQRHTHRQVPFVFVEVGRFKKDETLHKTYIEKYLPLSQSATDQRLMERILYWFHGRYRFTAILIELLLSTQSGSRHRIFTAFVHSLTGFTLTDAVDLEEKEPTLTPGIHSQLMYYAPVADVRLFEKSNDDVVKYIFHAVMRWRIASESTFIRINANMHQTIAAGIGHVQEVGPDQTFDMATNYPVYLCEPLVVLYLSSMLSERLDTTVEAWVTDKARLASDNSARGPVLEDAILLVLLEMFGGKERTLADVFDTDQPWGSRKVTLVALKRGFDGQLQCCPVSLVSGSSDRLGYRAKSPQDVVEFLNNPDGKCFLFPDNHMGPDLTCFLQDVITKELILLVLQSKLSKKLKSDACLGALASVTPEFFFNIKKQDGDRVNYAASKYPDLLDHVMTALLPLLGPAEYKPVVEGIRQKLRSSTKLDKKLASQPQRSTPRFLRIIASPDKSRGASFKADSKGDVGVLRWELVTHRFGDVVWDSPPSVA